jgi:molecular chaperone DnaK
MASDTGSMVGIDLGTSNSVAAHAGVQGQPPRVLDNQVNEPSTPSVVSVRSRKDKAGGGIKREVLVGSPALANQGAAPTDTIRSIKRLMGRGYSDKEVTLVRERVLYKIVPPKLGTEDSLRVEMGGTEYSPTDVSALILKKVKEGAEHRLTRPVTHAVVTVPAYFSEIQCRATRMAGRDADLNVIQLLKEPTAAAVAYERELDDGAPKTVLVYDLGGGTFDVSILTYTNGTYSTDNLEGDMWLGGDDFDALLEQRVLEKIADEYGFDPRARGVWNSSKQQNEFLAALRREVQKAKHTLSVAESADVILTALSPDGSGIDVAVDRSEFEELIGPLVKQTHDIVTKALRGAGAGITEEQVDYVILAGNATTVPAVQRAMEKRFGVKKLLRSVHPKHCVAMGAALIAAGASGVVCGECGQFNALGAHQCSNADCRSRLVGKTTSGWKTDVVIEAAPFAYGIQAAGDKFVTFINKNDPIPTVAAARKVKTLRTTQPGQRVMSYPIYGGENLETASANDKQGQAYAILPPGLPEQTPIRVSLWFDKDSVFEVSARLENGTDLKPWIQPKGETGEKVVADLQRLEARIADRAEYLPPDHVDRINERHNEVLALIAGQDFEKAAARASEIEQLLERGPDIDADQRARDAVGFAGQVLEVYGWLLPTDQRYGLAKIRDDLDSARRRGEHVRLPPLVSDFEAAIERFPPVLRMLIQVRITLQTDVQAADPELAVRLNRELSEAEATTRRTGEVEPLNRVLARIMQAVEAGKAQSMTTCWRCRAQVPLHTAICPNPTCRADLRTGDAGGR